jgi:hypothetical protein
MIVDIALLASFFVLRAFSVFPLTTASSCFSFRAQVSPSLISADSPLKFYAAILA